MKNLLMCLIAGATLLGAAAGPAAAQDDWPRRPIRLILPAGPGGTSDILLRGMSEAVGKALGQPLVFDNKAGAGGTLAATLAAQSEPDGYTLMVASAATHGIAPFQNASVPLCGVPPETMSAISRSADHFHPLGILPSSESSKLSGKR